METFGIAVTDHVAIDSLAHRLREEAMERDAVLMLPNQVGAWARITAG
jgi:hypothetical protein